MAADDFKTKSELIEQLLKVVDKQATGYFTVLTENRRSVLLRFSHGQLTRLHSRSNEPGEAIQILADADLVKFSFATAPEDDHGEFMPAQSFIDLIAPGGVDQTEVDNTASGGDVTRAIMLELAIEYVGMVAEMIVDEAFEESDDIAGAINFIAEAIPSSSQARAFRDAAKQRFTDIGVL